MLDRDGKTIRCEHCGSYEGPFVYRRELGAWYCIGHGAPDPNVRGPAYTPVEKPYRIVKCAPDGFVVSVEDSDTPLGTGWNFKQEDIFIDCYAQSTLKEPSHKYKKDY